MKKLIAICSVVVLFGVGYARAGTITDDFNAGISQQLWTTFDTTNGHVPVLLNAPDEYGRLQIVKSTEQTNTYLNTNFAYGLMSNFTLIGDFTISIDYYLADFPSANPSGWNDADLGISGEGIWFVCYRFADAWGGQKAGVAGGGSPGFGLVDDNSTLGKLGLTRIGNTIEGWIDSGNGIQILGSFTDDCVAHPVQATLHIYQGINLDTGLRSKMGMDVRFDNFSATADTIVIPEPATLLLLGFGAVMLRRKR